MYKMQSVEARASLPSPRPVPLLEPPIELGRGDNGLEVVRG
ncbi:MAG: hypothetical protein RDU25_00090 [Patescibacteria group bacterium]|nr:hypothetical protein [Patescibacteria group bacterium]